MSNCCARSTCVAVYLLFVGVIGPARALAQSSSPEDPVAHDRAKDSGPARIGKFLAGAASGLVAHEGGHLLFDAIFDADPEFKRVDFHGIPFFAISPRAELSDPKRFTIASAGFWVQHAGSEWMLTRRRNIRAERAPFQKGVLAFNILASVAYAGAALARTGPPERDTRGMAEASGIDERAIGALVLTPAVLDAWRYFDPDARWAVWLSRGVKVGLVLLVLR